MQESGEMYLETILVLSKKGAPVRSLDVANQLGFSKPSVSRAMGILKKGEFIKIDGQGYITLTPEGSKIAKKIYDEDMGERKKTEYLDSLWANTDDNLLQMFFANDMRSYDELPILMLIKERNEYLFVWLP